MATPVSDPALSRFKRKLTNLSSANPLLWMPRLRQGIHLDWTLLDSVDGERSVPLLNQVLQKETFVAAAPLHDARNADETRLAARFHSLQRMRNLQIQERAVDDLMLAWPFVTGLWPDGTRLRTPFLLIPADLQEDGKCWKVKAEISRAFLNPSWLLAYARYTRTTLAENLFEKELGLQPGPFREVLTGLYEILKESTLDLNFNSGLFSQPAEPFPVYTRDRFPSEFQPGMLRLEPSAVLGLFPVSDSLLLPDYEEMERRNLSLESVFVSGSPEGEEVPERNLVLPFPSDGTQEACLRAVRAGKSLVVQGPPGSGKSQLIANVVADSISSGKTVLVVCQKKVALEVIQQRLASLRLDSQVALWSDFKKDLGPLFAQLARLIGEVEYNEQKNKSIETVVLERRFSDNGRELEDTISWMEALRRAWFDTEPAGLAWLDLDPRATAPAGFDFSFLTRTGLNGLRIWIDRYWDECRSGRMPGSLSALRACPGENNRELPFFRPGSAKDGLEPLLDFQAFSAFTAVPLMPVSELRKLSGGTGFPEPEDFTGPGWEPVLNRAYEDSHPEDLRHQARVWELTTAIRAEGVSVWPFSETPGESFFDELAAIFYRYGTRPPRLGHRVRALFSRPARRWLACMAELSQQGISPQALMSAFPHIRALFRHSPNSLSILGAEIPDNAEVGIRQLVYLRETLDARFPRWHTRGGHLALAIRFRIGFDEAYARFQDWEAKMSPAFLSSEDQVRMFDSAGAWIEEREKNGEAILLSDHYLSLLPPEQAGFLVKWFRQPADGIETAAAFQPWLEQAWQAYWAGALRLRHPVLKDPPGRLEKEIRSLQSLIEEKNRLSVDLVRLRVEERAHQNLERNRLQNRVTYRGLFHQVSKKRQRMPLRQLWHQFGDEIRRLIPCWLATPESVSATWPLDAGFDLVIFDEASQCFAERGIPAAARGKQMLVLGDDKQLPPHHLFSTRFEEDDDPEDWFSSQDSFLGLARQYLPQLTLLGHYRSEYPELIAFSNKWFYQDRLRVFPHSRIPEERKAQLFFERTEGVWESQRNEGEAMAVVTALRDWFREGRNESLGVITFNLRQRDCIEEMLDRDSRQYSYRIPDDFFVKNIENVQGDERDHIWFSVAYAPGPDGAFPGYFGSLSMEGGENRLNVAITRARRSVRVFSSAGAEQFRSGNGAEGPRLLKAFLEFVQDMASAPLVNPEIARASWLGLVAGRETGPDGKVRILIRDPALLFEEPSVKAFFGLLPLYWKRLEYEVRFDFTTQGRPLSTGQTPGLQENRE